jgi:signal transduction histidine kinase
MVKIQFPTSTSKVSKRSYHELFLHSPIGMALVTPHGICAEANQAFRAIFGGENGNLLTNPTFLEMLHLNANDLRQQLSSPKLNLNGRSVACHAANGDQLNLNYHLFRIKRGIILIQVDNTARETAGKNASRETARLAEIGENTARIIHALKGSSAALGNTLEVLATSPDSFSNYLPNLQRIGQRLSEVVHQTLDSYPEAKASFQEVDLAPLLEEIKASPEIEFRLKQADIALQLNCRPSVVEAIRPMLKEAIVCLIENAIDAIVTKGPSRGKIIVLTASRHQPLPEKAEIVVEDNGIGIYPDKLAKIFLPFYTTKQSGSGIGLSVVKRTIETIHHGTVYVDSQPGIGTRFRLLLPRTQPKDLTLEKAVGVEEKLAQVQQLVPDLLREPQSKVEECISSMTLEHIRESNATELAAQIRGQIIRLNEFLQDGVPHLSANNHSLYSEVVLACDHDTASRNYWENLIRYELLKLGVAEQFSAVGTRIIQRGQAVCRIFEIKKGSSKLTSNELARLEAALCQKFTQLPTLTELSAQAAFLEKAGRLFKEFQRPGSLYSLIYTPALDGQLRLVNFRPLTYPRYEPPIEQTVAERFVLERPTPGRLIQQLITDQAAAGGLSIVHHAIPELSPDFNRENPYLSLMIAGLRLQSVVAAVFDAAQRGKVINLLCSTTAGQLPNKMETDFQRLNKQWVEQAKRG